MQRTDRVVSLILLAFSAAFTVAGYRYGVIGRSGETGAGFVPFWVGLLLFILSAVQLVQTGRVKKTEDGEDVPVFTRESLKTCALYIGGAAAAVFAAVFVGLVIPMALMVLLFNRLEGKDSWKRSAVIALGTAAGIYILFDVVLGVPVPTLFLQ